MKRIDTLWRGTAFHEQFRVFAVDSTRTTQKARDLHDLSPIATLLMSKMISAVALMSMELKTPGSEVSLRMDGDGDLKGGVAICTILGNVRCLAYEPKLFFDESSENFLPGKHIGAGTLSVTRHLRGKSPAVGHVGLVSGEVAEDLAHFYDLSEQIPTAINLGVLIDKDATIKAAGGVLIQQLPNADPKNTDLLIRNIEQTPNISDLMDMGLTIEEILSRFYFKDADVDIKPFHKLRYKCNCSRERFTNALRLLGTSELSEMQTGISPSCFYCNKEYHFTTADILDIIKSIEDNK